jgi:hypothetical protein
VIALSARLVTGFLASAKEGGEMRKTGLSFPYDDIVTRCRRYCDLGLIGFSFTRVTAMNRNTFTLNATIMSPSFGCTL